MEKIWVFILLAISTILNTIVPFSGSATTTPLLALITDPHTAIGLASFYFALSGIIRVFIFRKDLKFYYIKRLLPISLLGAVFGALSLIEIDPKILLIIILLFLIYFTYKKIQGIRKVMAENKKMHKLTLGFVGILSGFLQGFGLGGSDLRSGYLYSEKLTIMEVRGTSSFIGASNFLLATIIRLNTNQLKFADLSIFIYLLPIIIIATYLGRKVLLKINQKYSDYIIIAFMILMIVLLALGMFGIKL